MTTTAQISELSGVSTATLNRWKDKYPMAFELLRKQCEIELGESVTVRKKDLEALTELANELNKDLTKEQETFKDDARLTNHRIKIS